MPTAQYTFPSPASLEGEPSAEKVKGLEYSCNTSGSKFHDAQGLLNYLEGAKHKKKLEEAGLSEDAAIKDTLEKLKLLEAPHRALKKEETSLKAKEFLDKVKGLKDSMSKEEWRESQKKKREERREKIKEMIANGEEPPAKRRKGQKVVKVEPVVCKGTGVTLTNAKDVYAHVKSEEYKEKEKEFACVFNAKGKPGDANLGNYYEGASYRNLCQKLQAMGVSLRKIGLWDPDWEEKIPYRCGATGKELVGYDEVKNHLQSEEFAKAAAEYEDGCPLCGFKGTQEEVLKHYMGREHMTRLHFLAYYGMDVSKYYLGN